MGRRGRKRQARINEPNRGKKTYDKSRGVAVCDPLKLWAKLTFWPSWRVGFGRPAPPIGTPPPNAQPELLFAALNSLRSARATCTSSHSATWRLWVAYLAFRSVGDSKQSFPVVEAVVDLRSPLASRGVFVALPLPYETFVSADP